MPRYMLLLYSPEADEEERGRREAELPVWNDVIESLREAGLFVSTGRLHAVSRATTLRVRGDDAELTDGPFAVTKEVLGGYLLLDCADLDEALKAAAQLPIARYGSVEVRPLVDMPSIPSS